MKLRLASWLVVGLLAGSVLGADEVKKEPAAKSEAADAASAEAPKGKAKAKAKAKGQAKGAEKTEAPSAELKALAASLSGAQKTKLTKIVNTGDAAALDALPGVGEGRAKAIIEGRPYKGVLDLLRVPGIGEGVLKDILTAAKTPAAKS